VFFVGTMSVITILLQGSTISALLSYLGITKKTPVQLQHLLMAAKEVEEYANRNLGHLKVRMPLMHVRAPAPRTPLGAPLPRMRHEACLGMMTGVLWPHQSAAERGQLGAARVVHPTPCLPCVLCAVHCAVCVCVLCVLCALCCVTASWQLGTQLLLYPTLGAVG
jgi:hypothetical protein